MNGGDEAVSAVVSLAADNQHFLLKTAFVDSAHESVAAFCHYVSRFIFHGACSTCFAYDLIEQSACRCSLCDLCIRNAGIIAGSRHRNIRLTRICRLGRITRTFNRSDCCIFAGSTCTRISDRTRTRYDAPVVHSFHYHFSRAGTCVFHHLII